MKILTLIRRFHLRKLEKLILINAPYEKILKQSKIVDKYVVEEFKIMNNIK